jgi:pilus assembly protein Flp/PilA
MGSAKKSAENASMRALLIALVRDDTGATAIEYGLIAALISVAVVTVVTTVGHNLATTFNCVATKL